MSRESERKWAGLDTVDRARESWRRRQKGDGCNWTRNAKRLDRMQQGTERVIRVVGWGANMK